MRMELTQHKHPAIFFTVYYLQIKWENIYSFFFFSIYSYLLNVQITVHKRHDSTHTKNTSVWSYYVARCVYKKIIQRDNASL